MSLVNVLALIGVIAVLYTLWQRRNDDDFDDTHKPKNEDSLMVQIMRFFQPDPRERYFEDERSSTMRFIMRALKIIYIIFIAFMFAVASMPIVSWVYGIPPGYDGPLEEYSDAADSVIALVVLVAAIVGVAFLRSLPWRAWHALLAFALIAFLVAEILYESFY